MANTNLQEQTVTDVQLLVSKADAQFALTPMGQALKQFEITQRMGQMFAQSTIVPDTYKNNMPNCAIAIDMAMRMNVPPIMVMQNLYVVHGMPAWSSKFLIGCINGCGRFTPIEYKMKDNVAQDSDDYGCRCVAFAKNDTKKESPLYGPWVTWKTVKAEGWLTKNGSKWKTMPDLMFRYRAAAMWQRLYAPELSMGILTQEEAYDIQDAEYVEVKQDPAIAQPKTVVSDILIKAALAELDAADTAEKVRAVQKNRKLVYDNDEAFRQALIDKYESLAVAETLEEK